MKLNLYSDLHLDLDPDLGYKFLDAIKKHAKGVDVAILAGDIHSADTPSTRLLEVFHKFSESYSHTIFVPGNHEFYQSDPEEAWVNIYRAAAPYTNVHVLRREAVEINDQRFVGDTGWFPETVEAHLDKRFWSDFKEIKNLDPWVFEQAGLFEHYLKGNLTKDDILVMHHLPAKGSLDPRFARANTNCYFLHDIEYLIRERQPKLVVHGHTHTACDYKIEETRVACSPRGYVWENAVGYQPKLIEI